MDKRRSDLVGPKIGTAFRPPRLTPLYPPPLLCYTHSRGSLRSAPRAIPPFGLRIYLTNKDTPMSDYTFNRGTWSDGFTLDPAKQDEDLREHLARIGYDQRLTDFGTADVDCVEIYTSGDAFLAVVCPGSDRFYTVHLPDFPSLMMFLRDYAPAFTAMAQDYRQAALLRIAERTFRAEHGHDPDVVCETCDPRELERRARLRAEALERKRKPSP